MGHLGSRGNSLRPLQKPTTVPRDASHHLDMCHRLKIYNYLSTLYFVELSI
jgi:hypothetical protein